ncbi:hypothetical protein LTR33_019257 [Friedmanniomyces endolithicus]|nr:hypothetical protein LTR33_019257 [Friedmanniomyces endolithicus]
MSKHVSHLSPELSILGDSLQVHLPSIVADQTSQEQSLLEPYARFRSDPINALQEFGLHLTGTGWRSYDKIVGTDIFYPGFSENMRAMVMRQGKLQSRISELAQKRVEV